MAGKHRKQFESQPDVYVDDGAGEAYALLPKSEVDALRSQAGIRPFGKLEGGFIAMFQALQCTMARDNELTGDDRRVFQELSGRVDDENWLRVVQKDIAEVLEMHKQHVSRAIINLVNKGYILEGPKVGNCKTYRLNPHVGWKGSALKHKPAKKGIEAPTGGRKVIQGPWKEPTLF